MVRLIYFSQRRTGTNDADLVDLCRRSEQRNAALGISGLLAYDERFFLQVLEGLAEAVNRLYRDLVRDARHDQVSLIDYSVIDRRRFSDWAMGFARLPEIAEAYVNDRLGGFQPSRLGAVMAVEYLEILADYLRRDSA